MKYYDCPICGYDLLTKPPANSYICPCCGTEFESDDFEKSPAELRAEWIEKDMPWFSRSTLKPKNWSPYRQLIISDFGRALVEHARMDDDVNYRYEVNKAFSEVRIARQLKALREREQEPLTQSQLAVRADMKQSRISELEGMNYSGWSISTLERLAKALGVGFTYSFARWSDLVSEIKLGLNSETLAFPSFEREPLRREVVFVEGNQEQAFYSALQAGRSKAVSMLRAPISQALPLPSVTKEIISYETIINSASPRRHPRAA